MFDAVINHISGQSDWFWGFLKGESKYRHYFTVVEPGTDLSAVFRPRTLPLLTPVKQAAGENEELEKLVWTTFSLGALAMGAALPSSPAQIGVYEFAMATALSLIGMPFSLALSYAVVAHALFLLVTLSLGAYALNRDGASLIDLYRQLRNTIMASKANFFNHHHNVLAHMMDGKTLLFYSPVATAIAAAMVSFNCSEEQSNNNHDDSGRPARDASAPTYTDIVSNC